MALTAIVRASASDAPWDFIQKNANRVYVRSARPTKMMRQMPKPVTIGRPIARGGRPITSISCGSNEITSPSATDVTILTQRTCGRHGEAEEDGDSNDQRLSDVGGQQKEHGLFDVVVDCAPLLHRCRDRGEVVVGQYHSRGFLGHLGALDAHGDADVGLLE